MVLTDCLKDINKEPDSKEYRDAIELLLKEEDQWDSKLSPKQICLTLEALCRSHMNDDTINLISLFEKHKEKCKKAEDTTFAKVIHKMAEVFIKRGMRENAYDKCCEYLYYTCKGKEITDDVVLYSFRGTSDYVINDIKNSTLSLQIPSQFNDPLDTLLFKWIDLKIKNSDDNNSKEFYYLLKRAAEHFRVRCFVKPKAKDDKRLEVELIHPLMWAHYADSHKGVCIQYRFKASFFKQDESKNTFKRYEVEHYSSDIPNLNESITISNALFTKDIQWNYEEECRILDLDFTEESAVKLDKLNEDAIIEAVYFGYNCSDVIKNKVLDAVRNTPIKIYQMVIDDNNLHQLKAERIS